MKIEDINKLFEQKKITKIKLAGVDVDGVLRGKYISVEKFYSILEKGFGFCDVIFGWDSSDNLYDNGKFTGWHTGYPDTLAKIDISTMRFVPWENGMPFFLVDFYHKNQSPLLISPRQLLQKVSQRVNHLGYKSVMSVEYEYFLFQENSHTIRDKGYKNAKPLSPGMFGYSILRASTFSELIQTIIDSMREYDIEIEGIHTETGAGVYETALKYDEILNAADKAVLFKTGVKEIAVRHGIMATFMAKWNQNLAGCGGHIHQSLWDSKMETNLFYDESNLENISKKMRHYIAGQLLLMPELTVMFCPTINSYKRLVPNTWAATTATWGIENRTTALRVISGSSSKSQRIEHRLAGADVNSYLAMAASLAAGIYGIENELEPPPAVIGNAYAQTADVARQLPKSLSQAVELFKQSGIVRELFGDEFVEHYALTREWEIQQYQKAVTDWELERYFEII